MRDRKRVILGETTRAEEKDGGVEGQDLLTALMQANMDTELPVSQRMSDEDVLARPFLP